MKRFSGAAILFVILAPPALALDYRCDIRDTGDASGFIAGALDVSFVPGAGNGMVYSDLIHYVYKEPIEAKLKERGNGKYRLMYRVFNIPASEGPVDVTYTINLDTQTNTIAMRGTMPQFSNQLIGKGTCVPR